MSARDPLEIVRAAFGCPEAVEFERSRTLGLLDGGSAQGKPMVLYSSDGPPLIACRLDRLPEVYAALRSRPKRSRVAKAPGGPPPDGLALLAEALRHLTEIHPDLCNRIDDYLALAGRRVAAAPSGAAGDEDGQFSF